MKAMIYAVCVSIFRIALEAQSDYDSVCDSGSKSDTDTNSGPDEARPTGTDK